MTRPPFKPIQYLTRYRIPLASTTWVTRNWIQFWAMVKRGPVLVRNKAGQVVICIGVDHYHQFIQGQLKGVRLQTRFLVISWLLRTRLAPTSEAPKTPARRNKK